MALEVIAARQYGVVVGPSVVPNVVHLPVASAAIADADGGATRLATEVVDGAIYGWVAIVAFASSVAVLAAMPVIALLWSRGYITRVSRAPVDPETAGTFAVVFVTRENGDRWIPATVVRLARQGVLLVVDVGTHSRNPVHGEQAHQVWLELRADHADLMARASTGETDAAVALALFDGSATTGSLAPARRTPEVDARLAGVARSGLSHARRAYVDGIPASWLRAFQAGILIGIVGGIVALGWGSPPWSESLDVVAGLAIAFGLVGLIGRLLWLPRLKSLDATGIALRERSAPSRLFPRIDQSIEDAERGLPWAMLYRRTSVVSRYAEWAQRQAMPPSWYRSEGAFSAARFTVCMSTLEDGYAVRSHVNEVTDDLALFDGGNTDRPWYTGPWW